MFTRTRGKRTSTHAHHHHQRLLLLFDFSHFQCYRASVDTHSMFDVNTKVHVMGIIT